MPKVSTAACASALTTSNQSSHCVGSSWMPLYFMPVCVHVFLPGLTGGEPGFAGSVQLQPASTAGMNDVSTMGVTPSCATAVITVDREEAAGAALAETVKNPDHSS